MSDLPYRLTPATRERLLSALRAGCSHGEAAQHCNISRSTFQDWLRRAKAPDASEELKQFLEDVQRAVAEGDVELSQMIRVHALKDWKAAAWLKERRNPSEWGRRDPEREEQNERALQELRSLFRTALASGIFSGAVVLEQEPEPAASPEPEPLRDADAGESSPESAP